MRNTLKKKTELTYAELTQGRESTRLPHMHKLTSLKNVVISALHKIEYIFKPKCSCRRKSMQEKEPIMIVWCKLVQIESPVTQDNCLASLGKPRDAEQLPS